MESVSTTDSDPGRSFTITRRNGDVYTVLVSERDFDLVTGAGPWCLRFCRRAKTPYVQRNVRTAGGRGSMELLHRFIFAGLIDDKLELDHKNGNGLDCRRSNIRIASRSQNRCNVGIRRDNTSGFKGVALIKGTRKWRAYINSGRARRHLGTFSTPEAAHAAYCAAALLLHGEFARRS